MRVFTKLETVTWPVECSAVRGRAEVIRAAVKAHKGKGATIQLRQTVSCNGFLMLMGAITVNGHSFVEARATMQKVLDAITAGGIDRATLCNRF